MLSSIQAYSTHYTGLFNSVWFKTRKGRNAVRSLGGCRDQLHFIGARKRPRLGATLNASKVGPGIWTRFLYGNLTVILLANHFNVYREKLRILSIKPFNWTENHVSIYNMKPGFISWNRGAVVCLINTLHILWRRRRIQSFFIYVIMQGLRPCGSLKKSSSSNDPRCIILEPFRMWVV